MKKMKKVFAVMLSLAMVLGMAMTVSASTAEPTVPKYPVDGDSKEATVSGLQAGDTVSFYQIVDAKYEGDAFTGYKVVDGYAIANVESPTAEEITDIAKQIAASQADGATLINPFKTIEEITGTSVTERLEVGTYLVLVKAAAGTDRVYNPMIVSVYYDVNGVQAGSVSAGDDFQIGTNAPVYAKSSDVTLEKTIVNPGSGNNKGDDVAIGDTVHFQIEAYIPSYSDEYETIQYIISDTLDGLDNVRNIKVYLDDTKGEPIGADGHYAQTVPTGGKSFTLDFNSDYIKGLGGPATEDATSIVSHKFIVTYDATLSEDAKVNFDYNTNTAKLTYTHKPSGETEGIEKETYHYTFAIDGNLGGKDKYVTGEIIKTDDGDKFVLGKPEESTAKPLAGAEFSLVEATVRADGEYVKVEGATPYTATSDKDGRITFSGLDAGHYILQEPKAPAGYSVDTREHKVEITAVYYTAADAAAANAKPGMLKSYSIKIDGSATSTYEATYEKPDENAELVAVVDKRQEGMTQIKNTKLGNLPSTGGIGTTIFTIGGCAIMIIAAGLFFASRRKSSKDSAKEA